MKKQFLFLLLIVATVIFSAVSCSKDSEKVTDPLIGNSKIVTIKTSSGQLTDVTNKSCFKESYFQANASTFKFSLSQPQTGTTTCKVQNLEYPWTKKDNVYYYTVNKEEKKLPIVLSNNNQTLQFTIVNESSGTMVFTYTKQ